MIRLTLLAGLIAVIFGGGLWLAVPVVLPPEVPGPALIGQHSEALQPLDSDEAETFLAVHADSNGSGPAYMYVDLVVDEEFMEYFGESWRSHAYGTIAGANALMSEVGFAARVRSLRQWRSNDDVKFISSHIPYVSRQSESPPRHLTLAITAQATARNDGYFMPRDGVIIVQYDALRPRRIHSLIAHEFGHVIGAHHHDAEEECTGDGCIMDAEGHEHPETWCSHHKQEIEGKLAALILAG